MSTTVAKPSPAIFRAAARRMFASKVNAAWVQAHPDAEGQFDVKAPPYFSRFCCDNLNELDTERRPQTHCWDWNPEIAFFTELFGGDRDKDDLFRWWTNLPSGAWDYESRIFALLLCAEMIEQGEDRS